MSRIIDGLRINKLWIILGIILFLAISISYGLGYLLGKQENPAPIVIEKCSEIK